MRTCKCAAPKIKKTVRPYRKGAYIGTLTCLTCDAPFTADVVTNRCQLKAQRLTNLLFAKAITERIQARA